MKKLLIGGAVFFILGIAPALAGDCTVRDSVDWHATITSGVFLRSDCPSGDVVGTVPAGEVVQILEVDKYNEFYLVKTSVGTGFLFASFLKDINHSPLPGSEPIIPQSYPNSIFIDLNPNHEYYDEIADLKEKGVVSGNPEGKILADMPVNRAELAKILVEAVVEDGMIEEAVLPQGIYTDVQAGAWYLPYLQIAREKGIMSGDQKAGQTGATTVRPGDNANGGEVAKMIAEAFELEIEMENNQAWYMPYMKKLEDLNVLPYESASHIVTRGEMMFMISKMLNEL